MPMPALQEFIPTSEVGESTRRGKVGVALLAFLAFAVVYDLRHFKNFATAEAMDAAQVAHNIARGKGFTTEFVRPLSFYLLRKHQQETKEANAARFLRGNHPDLANPP